MLVNNAGGAFGTETVDAKPGSRTGVRMFDVNVIGTLNVTQALLPALVASGDGVLINMGSTAGRVAYEGGGGYTAAKHGVAVMTETLRLELARPAGADHRDRARHGRDRGVRAGPVPRRRGEARRGVRRRPRTRSSADDIADAVAWVATRPSHVNIDLMVVRPRAQAAQHKVYRDGGAQRRSRAALLNKPLLRLGRSTRSGGRGGSGVRSRCR